MVRGTGAQGIPWPSKLRATQLGIGVLSALQMARPSSSQPAPQPHAHHDHGLPYMRPSSETGAVDSAGRRQALQAQAACPCLGFRV